MKITDITVERFHTTGNTVADADGHGHPAPEPYETTASLTRIHTDDGVQGVCLGGNAAIVDIVKPLLVGRDPYYREAIWHLMNERQRLHKGTLSDKAIGAVDMALWDLAGKALGLPVYKLLGATRNKVPAYASTMCGDELSGGLSTPQEYADFALACKDRGYPGFKLHTWQPPIDWAPDPKMDIAACAAVREAVGPDIKLMLDPFHFYSRDQSRWIGRELEKLDYHWMEEPMDEQSMSSYKWLTQELDLTIVGPETMEGKMFTRAEWIVHGACDISRAGVGDVGGLTPLMKTIHMCEAHGVACEIHGGGPGNLTALCAMNIPGEFYERGLLHPFVDYEVPPPHLNSIADPLDAEGNVTISDEPGLGWDINWDWVDGNRVD
jgi:L-alanine-DL-glutamate epimerase-like enolase superfamily enzyme